MTRILASNGSYRDDGITDQAVEAAAEAADAFILASPTNFGTVTALFKRFMERLIVYAYWPWAMNAPQSCKAGEEKKRALLISSSAAPGILGRWLYGTHKQLQMTAKTIGAEPVGTLFVGLIAKEPHQALPGRVKKRAQALGRRLVNA